MHLSDALLSLLMRKKDFMQKLYLAFVAQRTGVRYNEPHAVYVAVVSRLLAAWDEPVKRLIRDALDGLRQRAGHRGSFVEQDDKELKITADYVDMDWGKSELSSNGSVMILRLAATHILMPRDPVVVESRIVVA